MVRFRFVIGLFFILVAHATLAVPARAEIEVGDTVVVNKDVARLMQGFDILATVRSGQELQVHKIQGDWIGTLVQIRGQYVRGWIAKGNVTFVRKAGPDSGLQLSEVMTRLSSSDEAALLRAIDDIATLGRKAEAAVPKLVGLLSADSDPVRWRAARALAAIGPKADKAVPHLAKSLKDANPLVRAHAVHALGQIGPASRGVVEELGKLIADPDSHVRRATVAAWRNIRPGPKLSIPIFLKVLEDAEGEVKIQAMLALSEAGREAVPGLIEALKNERAQYWACLVLQHIGPDAKDALPALLPLFKDDLPQVRMQAVMAMAEIGTKNAEHVGAVLPLLNDRENAVRYAAAYALMTIGPPAKAASDTLKVHLDDEDSFLATASAWALARVNDKDEAVLETAVTRLIAALKDKNQGTRVLAAKALADLQPPAERVAPALTAALRDADPEVLANVIDALATQAEAALPRATKALKNDELRLPAIMLLQRLGPKAAAAVPELVSVLKEDRRKEVRQAIIEALLAIGTASSESVPALVSMLSDDNLDVRRGATFGLGRIGPPARSALPAIRRNFDTEKELRPISIWAMVRIAPEDDKIAATAVPLLVEALKREEAFVRFEAARTLGLIGPRARAAIPALEAAQKDAPEHVGQAIAEALKEIKG